MPQKHKETNTFRFLRFADRISNINVDVIHRIGHRNEEDREEEVESYFHLALEKWNDLNCSQGWKEFQSELKDVQTLAQLVLLQEKVVSTLLQHLERKDPLTVQSMLDMVVALARDLRQDFYPYYPEFLSKIINFLNCKESEVLEWSFHCLAYLFKFLWRCMVRNVGPVLTSLMPLLSSKRPKYINYFAADSFAFLARKVKDPAAFFGLILNHLKEQPEDSAGCGRLVFAWLRGIKGQLHSCSQNVFHIMIQLLGNESVPSDYVFSLLSHTFSHLTVEIYPGGLDLLMDTMKVCITKFYTDVSSGKAKSPDALVKALKLVHQLCDHSEAAHVTSPTKTVDLLLNVYNASSEWPDQVLSELSSIIAILLMSPTVRLPQDRTVKLCSKVLAVSSPPLILSFVKQVLSWSALESLILPRLLEIVVSGFVSKESPDLELQILAELIQFKIPSLYENHEHSTALYNLDFSPSTRSIGCDAELVSTRLLNIGLNMGKDKNVEEILNSLETRMHALSILPHIKPVHTENSIDQLQKFVSFLCQQIDQISAADFNTREGDSSLKQEQTQKQCRLLMLLAASLETLVFMNQGNRDMASIIEMKLILDTLLPLAGHGVCRLGALRVLNLYLAFHGDLHLIENQEAVSLSIYEQLKFNLAAPHHLIRELTCRVFCQLPLAPELIAMFHLCLGAETTSSTITDYRDKLQYLQKLSYESIRPSIIKHSNYCMAPLYFILGSLYINFQLLWEPLQSLVASHAVGMSPTEFWPTFNRQLTLATEQRDFSSVHGIAPPTHFDCSLVNAFYSRLNAADDKPDHAHYRLLLWQTSHIFPEVCEPKNRDIAALFLTFMQEEYYISNADVANFWDIKKHDDVDTAVTGICNQEDGLEDGDITDGEDQDDDDSMDDENSIVRMKAKPHRKSNSQSIPESSEKPSARLLTKTLLAHLGLLSKMKNPRAMYREPEVSEVYTNLLSHKNPEIQKATLECVMTYKHKYLVPYSEHLFALIDNKTFKNEVTKFKIDKDSGIIQEEHRPHLIPIIMSLVYSKMIAKTGMRSGGKAGPALRRALVLRFLAGCHEDEMLVFVKLAFKFFDQFLQDDLVSMVNSIQSNINLEKVVPPRRLQSVVNLLSVVQERFGGLMGNRLLSLILQLLTCVGATVDGILKKRDDVHVGFLNALRLLRTSCIEVLTQFFGRFEAYPWSANEIDTVLQVFVWPVVDRLPVEGVHSPTALMKLFIIWSQHPRYFILLGSHAAEASEKNPLSALMKLLLGAKTHPTVCSAVMEVLENLLTLKDHKQIDENDMEVDETYLEERAPPIPVTLVMPLHDAEINALDLKEEVNLGSRLLYPHISSILERFKNRLASSTKKGSGLNKKELLVLSYVSEFVRAPDTSAALTQLLLPILTKRISAPHEDEEVVLKMMNTLNHLVRNVEEPHCYIRSIAALFSCINGVAGRKMLVSLIQTIAESSKGVSTSLIEDMNNLATVASSLNAYDKRWVEQPDFNTRLDAFKSVQSLAENGKLSVDLAAIVIHHCFYVIRSEKDMSLRDFASHCLRRVAPIISHQHCKDELTTKFLVDTTILGLIRNAISKDSLETVHSEAVLLLGEMARECSTLHPVLRDLNLLTNKLDIEVDFFENLQHLQLHRKTRALLKFCDVFQSVERLPNPRTLTQFILPLASQFICSEKYAGKNSLIDAAIKTIGIVCRLLPWHQYETCLRYYLGRLRISSLYQKQLVRIVMNILDAFHFDLSRAQKISGSQKANYSKAESSSNNVNEGTDGTDKVSPTDNDNTNEEAIIEDLAEQMDTVDDQDSEIDMAVEEMQPLKIVLAVERQMILCPSAATRVIQTITTGLLPQLQKALIARTLIESVHKVNKKQVRNSHHDRDAEEEEVLRVPMALAVVKLLQRLPKEMLTRNLPGVLVKLCTFLKSRLESVRRVTRETLQKVMVALGPTFLSTLLQEMTTLLTRGFQVHVLIFSIHSVLIALKDVFGVGDIDGSLPYIIEVCKLDLFGSAAEEKEEGKVASKLHEAQSTKSYNTLHLTAQFVSENHLTNILIPFKEIIQTAHSHKIVNRASECLRQIVLGLSENALVAPSSLLIFAVGVASESIPALALKPRKDDKTSKEKEVQARRGPDCFIIREAPKQRIGITSSDAARVAARMNAHVFVEFGLRLIYFLLKHEKLKDSGEDIRPLIDPVIPLFNDCLSSQHVKLSTLSLQCLSWLLRLDLPSLRNNISSIAASVFGLLHKFAAAGLSKGDNFDLVVAAFKAVAVLVRDVKYHTLDQDQLKALLLYAEQDVSDANKHATAFALLKAILSRKFVVPEIHDVMDRVATLSITSELPHVRLQARSVFHQFLMDYPLGKKLEKHLSFYLSQLNYELQPGRESALEMVYSVISSFPQHILSQHSGLFFLMLGARLVNDDVPDCRKMVAQCIIKMLGRLSKNDRDRLFNISLLWLRDKQVSHRRLAAQLCGTFVLSEKEAFQSRLCELLPAIITQFSTVSSDDSDKNEPGKFVRAQPSISETNSGIAEEMKINGEDKKNISESERMRDHHVYQVLQLVLKVCNHCPSWLSNKEFKGHIYNLTEHAQTLLAHPHEWVRLSAAQILTHILSAIDVQLLGEAVSKGTTCTEESENQSQLGFFDFDTSRRLKSMILDHCAQLTPGVEVGQQLLLQVVKNLVIFADVLKNICDETNCDNEPNDKQRSLSLMWLVKRMRKVVNVEVVQAPKSTVMRTMVLNWTAAVVTKLGGECIRPVLHHLVAPIVRELSSDEPAPEGSAVALLRSLSKEVSNLIKKSVGHETFIQIQSQLQTQISTVRAERRMKRKHEAVAEPEKAAKRKIQKQVRKKEAKKLRQMKMRGKKRKGKKEISLEDD